MRTHCLQFGTWSLPSASNSPLWLKLSTGSQNREISFILCFIFVQNWEEMIFCFCFSGYFLLLQGHLFNVMTFSSAFLVNHSRALIQQAIYILNFSTYFIRTSLRFNGFPTSLKIKNLSNLLYLAQIICSIIPSQITARNSSPSSQFLPIIPGYQNQFQNKP